MNLRFSDLHFRFSILSSRSTFNRDSSIICLAPQTYYYVLYTPIFVEVRESVIMLYIHTRIHSLSHIEQYSWRYE